VRIGRTIRFRREDIEAYLTGKLGAAPTLHRLCIVAPQNRTVKKLADEDREGWEGVEHAASSPLRVRGFVFLPTGLR
jgi:hypothetical protein